MKRLLCVVSSLDTGGAETFLMKIYRQLDLLEYQMDFCVFGSRIGYYEKEILNKGGKIFHIPLHTKYPMLAFKMLKNIVAKDKYDQVLKVTDTAIALIDILAIKLGGCNKIIARSCNANTSGSIARKLAIKFMKPIFNYLTDVKIAPSKLAGDFTFGNSQNVEILHNGLDLSVYKYDLLKRNQIRSEFNIGKDCFVIGHVGRFSKQKNHEFLIKVFAEIAKIKSNSILLLIGDGELKNKISNQIKELGISKKVLFAGIRSDIFDILSAMDAMVFPSFYEGMPNVVLEAQATNLPCIISDTITKEVDITNTVKFVSLNVSALEWANLILDYCDDHFRNFDTHSLFINNKYNIESVTKEFIKLVFGR